MNSAERILRRVLIALSVFAGVLALVAGAVGWAVAGGDGLLSAVIGAAIAFVFCALTVVSVLVVRRSDPNALYAVVLGVWIAKAVLLLVAALLLRGQPFIEPGVLVITLIIGAVGSVAIDAWVVLFGRQELLVESSSARRDHAAPAEPDADQG